MSKNEVGIIGLGRFGMQAGITLMELGHRVVGLDVDEAQTQKAGNVFTAVYSGDGTDKNVLEQLRFQDLDHVIVSAGAAMDSSILITLNLIELRAKHIIAKALSPQHAYVLERIGVKDIVQPERQAAVYTAHRIHSPGMLDLLPTGGGVLVQEVTVAAWAGKTLKKLALPAEYRVMVVATRQSEHEEYSFVPDPNKILGAGETLLLIGKPDDILALKP